ncbi:lipase family protein [Falsiroseomonas tokyonensis]|uniref:Alpha/beta hydrolase n=1 Tax=Falsiroseomonas tokyonensis TaxID=430521 RepID=A0ABV7BSD4_9PROT|nr:hypothetical protein [Falsiroseomonas tokyonensis]MBU8538552.1 hypothetical protein [Falsiroseomonas tokyonensis]
MTDAALAERLAGSRVLLCYGLLGEVIAGLAPVGLDYMGAQLAWLRGLGMPVQVVKLPTAAPVGVNAGRIAAALLADSRPAILVGHSKGGLEALDALLRPGMAARCRGFIALQAPFLGSPVADALLARRRVLMAVHHLARLSRLGTGRGLRDLTTATRQAWMGAHAAQVAALLAALPVATLASDIEQAGDWRELAYRPLARWMRAQGAGPGDGLVPVASALLPGARQRLLPGGHRALVARGPGRDPVGVLRAELWHIAEAPPAAMAIPSPLPPSPAPHPPPP